MSLNPAKMDSLKDKHDAEVVTPSEEVPTEPVAVALPTEN